MFDKQNNTQEKETFNIGSRLRNLRERKADKPHGLFLRLLAETCGRFLKHRVTVLWFYQTHEYTKKIRQLTIHIYKR